VELLRPSDHTSGEQRARLQATLSALEGELARLAAAIAAGGELPALLALMKERESARCQMRQQLEDLAARREICEFDVHRTERELRNRLKDWRELLRRNPSQSRQVLTQLLEGRVVFSPRPARSYEFTGKAHFGKFLKGIVSPQVFGQPDGLSAAERSRVDVHRGPERRDGHTLLDDRGGVRCGRQDRAMGQDERRDARKVTSDAGSATITRRITGLLDPHTGTLEILSDHVCVVNDQGALVPLVIERVWTPAPAAGDQPTFR